MGYFSVILPLKLQLQLIEITLLSSQVLESFSHSYHGCQSHSCHNQSINQSLNLYTAPSFNVIQEAPGSYGQQKTR